MVAQVQSQKTVVAATEVPEECVKRAQVVIVSEYSWHLIAPKPWKMHCLLNFAPVPTVTCPVIDVRGVPDEKSEAMFKVMQACVADHAGVINLDGLVTGLESLGAVVVRKKDKQVVEDDQAKEG